MDAEPPFHIAYVAYVDIMGASGENVFSRELVRALARQPGVQLSLIAPQPSQPLPADLDAPNVSTFFLAEKRRGSIAWSLRIQGDTLRHLRRARKSFGPFSGQVVTLRPATLVPPLFARFSHTRQILVVEGLEARNVSRNTSVPGASMAMTAIAWLNGLCSVRVMVAYGAIRDWFDRLPFVDSRRIEAFSHGVDPSVFPEWDREEARRVLDLPYGPEDYVVGFVGSYKWYHSLPVLISALARPEMKDVRVMLVGDGPEREAVTRLVAESGLQERVFQTGPVPHQTIASYIGACDLMFGARAPEHWSNPIKLIEYLAAGRPVIGYRTSEVEFIENSGVGALLDDVTPETVAQAILKFTLLKRSDRRELEERARRDILEHRTWDVLAARFVQVLLEGGSS